MSFDELRSHVAPAPTAMPGSSHLISGGGGTRSALPAPGATQQRSRRPVVPDHPQELEVYLSGPGADAVAGKCRTVATIDKSRATSVCKGRNDFILFEPLDKCAQQGRRIVIVASLGGGRELKDAQAYLASSLARWLSEQKVDGAGRPYGETKDEDPTLRKHFTREQIVAILSFGEKE